MLLTFTINKQLICRTDKEIPVAKSENYLYAQFSFSEEWEGIKTAIFNNGTAYSVQLDENNTCLVPWEVITESGFSVSVFCGERITANVSFVDVLPSGYIEGETPAPPSQTVYEQILDELAKRLSADDVIAGNNVTITKNADGTITISSSGGGGGSVEVDEVTLTDDNGIIKVKNGGIDTPQIKNGAVTHGKLADGAVGTVNVIGYAITKGKLEADLQNAIDSIQYKATQTALGEEATARQNADNNLQGQIDAITVSSDVVDVVGTYTDLENYDTSHVKANDIIKVLQDSTHNDALSYYRWIITGGEGAWTYVGSEGPFYTKGEADVLLQAKLGTDAVKQTTGSSTTDVMSQNAITTALSNKQNKVITELDLSTNTQNNPKELNSSFINGIYIVSNAGYVAADGWTSGDELRMSLSIGDLVIKSDDYTSFSTQGVWYTVDNTGSEVTDWNTDGYTATINDVNTALADYAKKRTTATLSGSSQTLADNTKYKGTGITTMAFTFPSGDFECYIELTTAASGTISITFPNDAKWIGDEPTTYENDKTYHFSVLDGVVVAGEAV